MTKPVYTSAARQDLADILAYIARDKPRAAVEWVEKIEAKCLLIADQPAMGDLQRQLGVGVRANLVGRYVKGCWSPMRMHCLLVSTGHILITAKEAW
ncbi:MAG TPA: type II toxin-antitoxin system RelE/ParE family toxin [Pirellulaceae bacterium]|nr:type II toxin-antitoxin system RelE/ParE family toxin [Pirellulaceae bacterium]